MFTNRYIPGTRSKIIKRVKDEMGIKAYNATIGERGDIEEIIGYKMFCKLTTDTILSDEEEVEDNEKKINEENNIFPPS